MRLPIFIALGMMLASCGTKHERNDDAPTQLDLEAAVPAVELSEADLLRVCKGGAAFRNGRDVKGIDAHVTERQIVRLSYVRDDGKEFQYDCMVEGNVLRFRMIDEAGPGTGPGTWSGEGSRTTFELSPSGVKFTDEFSDGSSDTKRVAI